MKPLKQRLVEKETVVGSWLSFNYTATAEIIAKSGFDFVVVDMEHPATGVEGCWRLIQIIELAGSVPLVRVGANDPLLIKHALDSGAHGIIVPMVNTAAEAQAIVQAAYYPPRGSRGVGLWRAQGYGASFDHYRQRAQTETVVIAQIEHHAAVDNLVEILNVEGIDGFLVGPYDLSGSIGAPGDFDHPRFRSCLAKLHEVLSAHPKPGGYHIVHPDLDGVQVRGKIEDGYRILVYSADEIFFSTALNAHSQALEALGLFNRRCSRT